MGFGWGNLYVTARFCLLQKPQVENRFQVSRKIAKYGRLIVVNFHDKYNYRCIMAVQRQLVLGRTIEGTEELWMDIELQNQRSVE